MADGFAASTLQHGDYFLYVAIIFIPGDGSHAATFAPAYVELQAWTIFAVEDGLGVDLEVACPQRIYVPEHFEQAAGMEDRAVWSEVSGPVLDNTAGQEDLREFISGYAYPRIGLGILQQDVVLRLVLLYEVILEQQGVGFGIYHRVLGVRDPGDEQAGLAVEPGRVHEVLGDPFVEVFCLADINHSSLGVIITIDPGGMWK